MKKCLFEKAYEEHLEYIRDRESELPFYDGPRDVYHHSEAYVNFVLNDLILHGYIKKHYPKLSREKHDAMWFKNRYPILFGIAKEETCTLKSIRQVARFICRNGVKGDVCIINMHGELFLDTFGLYINKIADNDYLEELKKVLIPMQKRIEKNIFKKA